MRGQVAPLAIVDCIEVACFKSPAEGLAFETERYQLLFEGAQRRALTHIFFAERSARKIPGLSPGAQVPAVNAIGVVGAGSMGVGIAVSFATAGLPVVLLDLDAARVERALASVRQSLQTSVERGSISDGVARQALLRILGTIRYEDLANVGPNDFGYQYVIASILIRSQTRRGGLTRSWARIFFARRT